MRPVADPDACLCGVPCSTRYELRTSIRMFTAPGGSDTPTIEAFLTRCAYAQARKSTPPSGGGVLQKVCVA